MSWGYACSFIEHFVYKLVMKSFFMGFMYLSYGEMEWELLFTFLLVVNGFHVWVLLVCRIVPDATSNYLLLVKNILLISSE